MGAFANLRQQEAQLRAMETTLANEFNEARHSELLKKYGEAQARFEHAGGYTYEQTIRLVLTGLGFEPEDYQTPLTKLSGGQQSRAHLARLLLDRPDLLLLDEPTNHLDLESCIWFERYLESYRGAVLVVSHDRAFLNRVVNKVIAIEQGECIFHRGNYDSFVTARQKEIEIREATAKRQNARMKKEIPSRVFR